MRVSEVISKHQWRASLETLSYIVICWYTKSLSYIVICWYTKSLNWRLSLIHCCCCQVASVVSDSVRPHGLQPTRLLRPWDSPGKNTGAGCHFLLQCMKVESESEVTQSCLTLSDPMDCSPPGSSIHGIFRATVLEWGAIAFSHLFTKLWYKDLWSTHSKQRKDQ